MYTQEELNKLCPQVTVPNVPEDVHLEVCNSLIEEPANIAEDEEFYSIIFARDPLTGLPSSDLSLLVKNKFNDDVQKFIEMKGFQKPHDDSRLLADTDISLTAPSKAQYGTERDYYIQELRRVALEGLTSEQKSQVEKTIVNESKSD